MASFSLSSLSLSNGSNSASASAWITVPDLTFFPELPLEVQRLIWCMAAMEPEIISVSARPIFSKSFVLWTPIVLTSETRLKSEDRSKNPIRSSNKSKALHTPKANSSSITKRRPAELTSMETGFLTPPLEASATSLGSNTSKSDQLNYTSFLPEERRSISTHISTSSISPISRPSTLIT